MLQVTHVGVCGTDTSYWHEGERYRGVVIGHEYSGVVVAPGTNRALKPGDRVAGYTQNVFQEPCGHCEACLAGDWDHCTNRRVFTWKGGELGHPGAYSQYTTWFPHSLVKPPDNVTNEEGAMAEPFAVGLHAIQVSQVKPNDRVLILGGGIDWHELRGVGQNLRRQWDHRLQSSTPRSGRSSGAIRWLTMWWLPTPPTWSSSCWISRGAAMTC